MNEEKSNTFYGKHCFVAGASGFLGYNIASKLHQLGAIVISHSKNTPVGRNLFFSGHFTQDMTEPFTFDDFFNFSHIGYFDYVFHCAAFTGGATVIKNNPSDLTVLNSRINLNLLDAAAKAGTKKFVFISSSAVYPEVDEEELGDHPMSECHGFDGDPADPFFGPGWMKRYGEKLAEFYHRQYGMEILVIRPSNVYGPYSSFDLNHSHVIPALIRKFVAKPEKIDVWGTDDVMRDLIYADDFVRGVLLACEKFNGFDIYNIATGVSVSIGEVVSILQKLTNYEEEITFDSSKPVTKKLQYINSYKAESQLGFKPEFSLEEGLRRTIAWYKNTKEYDDDNR